jgi:hypothetical protein
LAELIIENLDTSNVALDVREPNPHAASDNAAANANAMIARRKLIVGVFITVRADAKAFWRMTVGTLRYKIFHRSLHNREIARVESIAEPAVFRVGLASTVDGQRTPKSKNYEPEQNAARAIRTFEEMSGLRLRIGPHGDHASHHGKDGEHRVEPPIPQPIGGSIVYEVRSHGRKTGSLCRR